jgi:hypothetical protein
MIFKKDQDCNNCDIKHQIKETDYLHASILVKQNCNECIHFVQLKYSYGNKWIPTGGNK